MNIWLGYILQKCNRIEQKSYGCWPCSCTDIQVHATPILKYSATQSLSSSLQPTSPLKYLPTEGVSKITIHTDEGAFFARNDSPSFCTIRTPYCLASLQNVWWGQISPLLKGVLYRQQNNKLRNLHSTISMKATSYLKKYYVIVKVSFHWNLTCIYKKITDTSLQLAIN